VLQGRSLRVKVLAGVVAVTALAGGVIGYKLTHKGPPSFRKGGQFAIAGPPNSTTTSGVPTAEATATTAAPPAAVPGSVASSATTGTTAPKKGQASSTTMTTRAAAATTTTRAASGPAPAPSPTSPSKPSSPPAPTGLGKPALGTYTYTVDGSEQAPFVGARKYPNQMTTVVHASGGVEADQLVFDITYSENHAEREIVGFRNDGIYFDFEGGSITFGPRTETSQADYDPPILQIPLPLQPGLSRTGVTQAKGADGKVSRTEDWKTTVLGQEALTIGGTTVNAWKVEVQRKFRPGSADQGFRNRTYWFDPARRIWVKYTEVFHGERRTAGFSFTYDSNLTAVLANFTA
jgi:hypothetical protein